MTTEIINTEIVAIAGLVFAAAALGRFAYERQMDVLHGSYIEGREAQPLLPVILKPLQPTIDRLRWKLHGVIYLATIAAC